MTVHLWKARLSWVAVPKVACTSIKHAFFQVENDRPFDDFVANGQYFHIHHIYPTRNFADLPHQRMAAHLRLAVIRDPVSRLLSCYGDRVIYNRELSAEKAGAALADAGLPTNPGLEEFVARLDDYRRVVPSIHHHAAPQTTFLGPDPGYYGGVYSLKRLPDFANRIGQALNRPFPIEHFQIHGPKFDPSVLSARGVETIRSYYQQDYDHWGRFL